MFLGEPFMKPAGPSHVRNCSSQPNRIMLFAQLYRSLFLVENFSTNFFDCIFFLDSRFTRVYILPRRVFRRFFATLRYMPPWAATPKLRHRKARVSRLHRRRDNSDRGMGRSTKERRPTRAQRDETAASQ